MEAVLFKISSIMAEGDVGDYNLFISNMRSKENFQDYFNCFNQICLDACSSVGERFQNYHSRLVSMAQKYICQNYSDPELNLAKIAKHVNLSANYVSTIFKKHTGIGVAEYLNLIRMEKAKQLLMNTELKVGEISDVTGHSSQSYFSINFKKQFGYSPMEFRKMKSVNNN